MNKPIRIVFQVDLSEYPGYAIHYCREWTIQARIWSYKRDRYLKDQFNEDGSAVTKLSVNNRKYNLYIHRLLIEHFEPEKWIPEFVVNHIDRNNRNNNLDNLDMKPEDYDDE